MHGDEPLGRLSSRFCTSYLRHRESCRPERLGYVLARVPLRHRDASVRIATCSTVMNAPAQRPRTAYNCSGPRVSPCCEHSAKAETRHRMGYDIDATEHNICVTATDPATPLQLHPTVRGNAPARKLVFLDTISTTTEVPHFQYWRQLPRLVSIGQLIDQSQTFDPTSERLAGPPAPNASSHRLLRSKRNLPCSLFPRLALGSRCQTEL